MTAPSGGDETGPDVTAADALALCREFPGTCAGSGGMGGVGGPCAENLEVASFVDPAVMPEFIDQLRDDLRRLW